MLTKGATHGIIWYGRWEISSLVLIPVLINTHIIRWAQKLSPLPCYEVLSMFDHFHPLQSWMVYFCPLARPLWNQIYGFGLLTTLILSHQAMFVKDCDQWGKSMLIHWGRDKMAAVLQTTLSNAFFLNKNVRISLKFVPKVPINNIPALFQIMSWRRPGDKPLSETTMVTLPTHICVTRPQWVKQFIEAYWRICTSLNPVITGSVNG